MPWKFFSNSATERWLGSVSPTSWSVSKSTTFLALSNPGMKGKMVPNLGSTNFESAGLPAHSTLWVYGKPAQPD
jgi:hypothetical protein